MPSMLHEALLLLFRARPALAPELLRDVLGLKLPAYTEVRVESAELTQVAPAEYHADLVVLLLRDRPVFAIVLEAQLSRKGRKRFTWPAYATSARAQFRCAAIVLVVTPDARVARWAARPIHLGGGSVFVPLVIGPEGVPVVRDRGAPPELAVLSAMAHGKGPVDVAVQIALAAAQAVGSVADAELRRVYYDLVTVALSEAARKAFEMLPEGYEFQSEAARNWIAKGEAKGKAEGEAKGKAEGEAKGKAEGEAKGKAEGVLEILDARGIALADAQRARVLACADLDTLRLWIRRAVTLSRADELFEE